MRKHLQSKNLRLNLKVLYMCSLLSHKRVFIIFDIYSTHYCIHTIIHSLLSRYISMRNLSHLRLNKKKKCGKYIN